MVSFALILCSALLLSGAIAAPHPEENSTDADLAVGNGPDSDTTPAWVTISQSTEKWTKKNWTQFISHFRQEESLGNAIGQQASQAGVKVLIDVLDGKKLLDSIVTR